jgi:hypothetical protein
MSEADYEVYLSACFALGLEPSTLNEFCTEQSNESKLIAKALA